VPLCKQALEDLEKTSGESYCCWLPWNSAEKHFFVSSS
jgi:hypothetical protein